MNPSSLFFCLSIMLALCSCGAEFPSPGSEIFNCSSDGFCATPIGKKSLVGAFRKGEHEIRFESYYRPQLSLKPGTSKWSVRVTDWQGNVFLLADNGNLPSQWLPDENDSGVTEFNLDTSVIDGRIDLTLEMWQAIATFQVPEGRDEAWREVTRLVANFSELANFSPSYQRRTTSRNDEFENEAVRQLLGEGARFASENLLNLEEDLEERVTDDARQIGTSKMSVSTIFTTQSSRSDGLGNFFGKKKISPSNLQIHRTKEFHQTISLHSQPTKWFLLFGPSSRKHHSAAKITVYSRAIGSNEPWRIFLTALTGNHGTEPEHGAMKEFAFCDQQFPITKGYFAWLGECQGKWGDHYCNDDTAYQVWHAYGNWNGGRHCHRKDSYHRPKSFCNEPWPEQRFGETIPYIMPAVPAFYAQQ